MMKRVTIDHIGAKGDGVAHTEDGSLFIPRAIPGDVFRVDGEDQSVFHLETPSLYRVKAMCSLFGTCGGCVIQEADNRIYQEWKRGLVVQALTPLGLADRVDTVIDAHGEGRRRVTFHARRRDGEIVMGFMRAKTHDVIDVPFCPLLVPALRECAALLKSLVRFLVKADKAIDVAVTATPAGLDVDLRGYGSVSPSLRMALTQEAERLDLARLSVHGDIIVERRTPRMMIGTTDVILPPGSFLQATDAGQKALQSIVSAHCQEAGHIADLFSGLGTFALPLGAHAPVHAVETDAAALHALQRALKHASGLKPITTEARDLFRRPLVPSELSAFDHVVLDPPRAGAEAQARMLAQSKVSRLIYVSCHVGSFSRDAALLVAGGYQLRTVKVVDQFRYSTHCEVVGIFERDEGQIKPKRRLLG